MTTSSTPEQNSLVANAYFLYPDNTSFLYTFSIGAYLIVLHCIETSRCVVHVHVIYTIMRYTITSHLLNARTHILLELFIHVSDRLQNNLHLHCCKQCTLETVSTTSCHLLTRQPLTFLKQYCVIKTKSKFTCLKFIENHLSY